MNNINVICHCEIGPYKKGIQVTVIQYDNIFKSLLVSSETSKTLIELTSKSKDNAMRKYRKLFKEGRNIIYPL